MKSLLAFIILCASWTAYGADPAYMLGPEDQVVIRALDTEEIGNLPYRIDMRGNINVPLAGTIHAAGLTVAQLESVLRERLSAYLRTPVVTISISEFGSEPVSVLGAVTNPGVHQIRGRKTLFEVLSEAGGLKTEAGNTIKITRRVELGTIPLPGSTRDTSGNFWVAEVSARSILEAQNPSENIPICPNDIISVPRASLVYVIGAVKRTGGFVLTERDHITVLEALAMAEGVDRAASASRAKILRQNGSLGRKEIAVNVNKILAGKSKDLSLQPDDILFVPSSALKSASMHGIESAIQLASGVAIYRL